MRFSFKTLIFPILLAGGCAKSGQVSSPVNSSFDPVPVIIAALESGSQIASVTADMAVESGDFIGCLVGDSLASALSTGSEGVAGNLEGNSLPAVSLELGDCFAIGETPEAMEIDNSVESLVSVSLSAVDALVVAYSPQISCEAGAWVSASIEYARGVAGAVISELTEPNGSVSIPGVEVAECD